MAAPGGKATLVPQRRYLQLVHDALQDQWYLGHEPIREQVVSPVVELYTQHATLTRAGQGSVQSDIGDVYI